MHDRIHTIKTGSLYVNVCKHAEEFFPFSLLKQVYLYVVIKMRMASGH